MSIHEIINKIKGDIGIDKTTFLYLLIVIGVGISSFGLGRLSYEGNIDKEGNVNQSAIVNKSNALEKGNDSSDVSSSLSLSEKGEKLYVASKNGKMYYSLGCSGAKRIKPENEIWFASKEDAEKSGFTFSATCK